jgi:Skp family chaperone for outer membrane proteins
VQSVASILDRFRRAAGVPAAAVDDIAAEVAPVFAALEQVEAEAQTILASAVEQARHIRADAEARAATLHAACDERARAEYARAESESEHASHTRLEAVEVEARQEAELLRREGRLRMAELVEEVVACVRGAAR